MADNYMISRADMLRLVSVLQRQSIGVKYAGERLRITEDRHGTVTVTDVRFRPVVTRDGGLSS
ncbi:hypothetical protein [Collinsella sp.]|uniref:hypothetical protein n=2 Tax=Collinsella sp. TaxID=1965294 RepID=UPI003990445B